MALIPRSQLMPGQSLNGTYPGQQRGSTASSPFGGSPWGPPGQTGYGAPVVDSGFNVQAGGQSPLSSAAASGTATGGNANTAAATKFLNGVLAGKNLPYDKTTQSNMLSEQSGMAAAAEGARNQELNNSALAGGSSYNDPSLAGGRASNMAARQAANMNAARDIAQNANVQNFDAQQQAAKSLATFGLAESDRAQRLLEAMMSGGQQQSAPTVANSIGQGYTMTGQQPTGGKRFSNLFSI